MRPPEGVERIRWAGARGWIVPEVREWATAHLTRWGTLARAAEHDSDAILLRGRDVVRAIEGPENRRLVVRRYMRGGWVARFNTDRFLRLGTPRPEKEMWAASVARERGLPTPRIVAALHYRRGLTYRAEIVSEYVADSVDMAGLLFHDRWPGASEAAGVEVRHEVLRQAGHSVSSLARAGVHHRDLNAKNLLVSNGPTGVRMHILDFDRARVHPGPIAHGVMAARLERSLHKFEAETDRGISEAGWAAFREGLRGE